MANTKIPSELIADSSITAAKLADGTITTADIADSNVTTAKIADSGVTTAKIGDAQVTTAKITDANVTTGKIADDAVTTAKMASNSVTSDTLASGLTLAGNTNVSGTLTTTGNITLNSTGNLDIYMGVAGSTEAAYISRYNNDLYIYNKESSGSLFLGTNNGTKVTIDTNGTATFIHDINIAADDRALRLGAGADFALFHDAVDSTMRTSTGNLILSNTSENNDIIFKGNDSGTIITALTLDMSAAGAATFNDSVTAGSDIEIRSGNKLILQRPNNAVATEISTDSTGAMILDSLNSEGFFFNNNGTNIFKLDPVNATFAGTISSGAITSSGNLTVSGDAIIQDATPTLEFKDTDNNLIASVGGASGSLILKADTGGGTSGESMQFHTGSTERMRIDSSGNVGIGTTPSTGWVNSTDFSALQIGSGLALWGRGSGDHERLGLTANIYHDGSAYRHIHTGRVTSYEQNDGKHIFKYHASQSAGASVTPTTAMTIDTSGKVGIGETSPDKQLHIKNTATGDTGIVIENTNNAQNLDIDFYNNVGAAQGRIRYSEGAGSFGFAPNVSANNALHILYGGNVGIGTTAPPSPLSIFGTGTSSPTAANTQQSYDNAIFRINNFANSSVGLSIGSTGSNVTHIQTSYNEGTTSPLTLNPFGGNVGIGTSSPGVALDILTATANTNGVVRIQNNMDNNYEALRIHSLGNYDAQMSFLAQGDSTYWGGFGIDYSDAGKFKLQTDNLFVGGSNLMTWARDGKVGIGTSSPSQKFEVFPDDDHAAIIGRAKVGNLGYSDFAGFAHLDSGSQYAILQHNTGETYVNAASGYPINFRVNNANVGRIDTDGLKFGTDAAAANALDDYEEGTWTPTFSGATLSTAVGTYTKIGNIVTVSYRLVTTGGLPSSGSQVQVGGLPFTISNATINSVASGFGGAGSVYVGPSNVTSAAGGGGTIVSFASGNEAFLRYVVVDQTTLGYLVMGELEVSANNAVTAIGTQTYQV